MLKISIKIIAIKVRECLGKLFSGIIVFAKFVRHISLIIHSHT